MISNISKILSNNFEKKGHIKVSDPIIHKLCMAERKCLKSCIELIAF